MNRRKILRGETFAQVFVEKIGIHPGEFWSIEENGGILPTQVSRCSNKKFYFNCHRPECGHLFMVCLADCTLKGNWCPYCAGKVLCENQGCNQCYTRSYQSEYSSSEWYQIMNEDVKPRQVLKNSHKVYYFICHVCGHYYKTRLDRKIRGDGCPYCNGDELCPEETCEFCFNNSLSSHHRSRDVTTSPGYNLLDLDCRFIRKYSNKKIWFTCSELKCKGLGHHFESKIDNVTLGDTWCPFCSKPPKRMCNPDEKNCETCLDKSVFRSKVADRLKPGQNIDPRTIFKGSHKKNEKLIFVCEKKECGREFKMYPNNAIFGGQWCPYCKKKTEEKLMKWLEKRFPKYKIKREWKPCLDSDGFECKNPDTDRNLPFDFYIPHLKLIIEIDGPQHFVQIHNWKSPEETRKIDLYKESIAVENDLTVIRLLQTDVYYDKNDWDVRLCENISVVAPVPVVIKIYGGKVMFHE